MPAYICRWPNGDVSVVSASTEVEVADVLDEVDNPDEAELIELGHPIAVHFKLGDKSNGEGLPLEYEGINEDLEDSILERAYPIFNEVLHREDVTDASLSTALEHEKNPIYSKQPDMSENPAAADVQQQLGMPKALVEHFAQNARRNNNFPANLSAADVRKVLCNPVYCLGRVAPWISDPPPPIISEEQWIAAGAKMIEELGADDYLRLLIANLKGE